MWFGVFSAKTAKSVRKMMETVLMKDGTAYEARVDGYSAAGKTGTVKKRVPEAIQRRIILQCLLEWRLLVIQG